MNHRVWFKILLGWLLLASVVANLGAAEGSDTARKTFLIGAENINYFPHYDFTRNDDKGYAWAVLQAFAEHSGYQFNYLALPIKRLKKELHKGTIDFAYPDNPKWRDNQQASTRYYSVPFTIAMGGTMVRANRLGQGLQEFDVLSVPLGFNPVKWLPLIEQRKVQLVEVLNAQTALEMVLKGRADGADIEYNVAKQLLRISGKTSLMRLDPSLPYDTVGFSLSTIKHEHVILQINQFIKDNPDTIAYLTHRYQLQTPEKILSSQSFDP